MYGGTSLRRNNPLLGPYTIQRPVVFLGGGGGSRERGTPVGMGVRESCKDLQCLGWLTCTLARHGRGLEGWRRGVKKGPVRESCEDLQCFVWLTRTLARHGDGLEGGRKGVKKKPEQAR